MATNETGARLLEEDRARFDTLDPGAKLNTYRDLGHASFVALYGDERIPGNEAKSTMKYPDGNPKTVFGVAKPDTWSIDPIAIYVMGMAMLQGNLKYGLYNYFDDPVSVSTYVGGAQRHLDLYRLGQENASDTDIEHLGHLMACAGILISAKYHGKLIDDRTKNIQMAEDLDRFFQDQQPRVKAIREKWTGFAERNRK